MKFRRDGRILTFMTVSLVSILIGILILLFIQSIAIIGIILISCGLVGLVVGLHVSSKPINYFMKDERSARIKEKAGYSAFVTMLSVTGIISFFNILKLSPSLTPSSDFFKAALVIGVVGLYAFQILKWYYNKTGE